MGDLGSILGLRRSHGEGKGCPLQYSCLENFNDCMFHGVAKSRTQPSDFHFTSLWRVVQNWFRWPRIESSWILIQPVSVGPKKQSRESSRQGPSGPRFRCCHKNVAQPFPCVRYCSKQQGRWSYGHCGSEANEQSTHMHTFM